MIKQFTHKSAWWSKSYRFDPSAQGIPFPLGPSSIPFSRTPHNSPGVPPAAPRKRATTVRTLQPLASSSELSPLRGKCAAPPVCLLLHVVDACRYFLANISPPRNTRSMGLPLFRPQPGACGTTLDQGRKETGGGREGVKSKGRNWNRGLKEKSRCACARAPRASRE